MVLVRMSEKPINYTAILSKIADNYSTLETRIANELQFSVEHHLTAGTFREGVWKQLFRQIVPRKFSIEQSVFIVDSNGKVSREVDLAIFDEQYTPYIFRYENMKYIPIEAVAVVVQCKSNGLKVDSLVDWTQSITNLKTSLKSIARLYSGIAYGEFGLTEENDKDSEYDKSPESTTKSRPPVKMTQSSTRPIRILCHTGKSTSAEIKQLFDFVVYPKNHKLEVYSHRQAYTLMQWHKDLNHVDDALYQDRQAYLDKTEVKDYTLDKYKVTGKGSSEEISVLSLTFQLNQLLMLINNPIQFPHLAYVEMFNRIPRKQ